jgi:DNA-binding winged helix-turn-helix (wHTH) protein
MAPGFTFGPFCLLPRQRLLLDSGRPVRIGSRAFDILAVLVERPGELVTSKELLARVWPTTTVCDDNLSVHISALRRVLKGGGESRCIVNVPGRGYFFVAQVEVTAELAANEPARAARAMDAIAA